MIPQTAYKGCVENTYLELAQMIERLHRRFLDVVRAELNRMGIRDLNPVQALLLANIGGEQIVIRDLIERGYYQGSNVSYNMKKLVDAGYVDQERSQHDKRSVSIKLTPKALEMCEKIRELEDRNAKALAEELGSDGDKDVETVRKTLRRLERVWSDSIDFGH